MSGARIRQSRNMDLSPRVETLGYFQMPLWDIKTSPQGRPKVAWSFKAGSRWKAMLPTQSPKCWLFVRSTKAEKHGTQNTFTARCGLLAMVAGIRLYTPLRRLIVT
ncbi:hypothetical protein ACFL2Q_01985 [Thermodesulfobacteriota bacterium]